MRSEHEGTAATDGQAPVPEDGTMAEAGGTGTATGVDGAPAASDAHGARSSAAEDHSVHAAAAPASAMGEGEARRGPRLPLARRFWRAFISAPRAIHLLLLLICFILGLALATQVRAQRSDPLDQLTQEDLVVLLDELSTREDTLREQRVELESQLNDIQSSASSREAAEQAAQKAKEVAEVNAGLVPVGGPGVRMEVIDVDGALTASQFVMALGELRNAGAEAVALNGVRLTARSSFTQDGQVISVDGVAIESPYVWEAIGDAHTISTALEIQAGSAAQMRSRNATVRIEEVGLLEITATAEPVVPRWAEVE